MIINEDDYVNKEYAVLNIFDEPIIITKMKDDKYVILDGKHRLYKAKVSGQKKIEAYFLKKMK